MKAWMRMLMILSAVLIGVTYFFPLWRFELWAPQYPEGLSMEIWTTKFTGDVRNINILNHYVGMRPIEADNFPELKFFPFALGFFALTAVLIALLNLKRLSFLWIASFLIFCAGALADFYIWEYRFGHELSEDAAIKMEDQVYQPPFIGSRTLLTITAKSYPVTGGIALASAGGLALLMFGAMLFGRKRKDDALSAVTSASLVAILALMAGGCQNAGPEPILFGQDSCHACKMNISDRRFGGELVTATGKVFKFDSLDCLIPYFRDHQGEIKDAYVVDAFKNGELVEAIGAKFTKLQNVRSPMGVGTIASADSSQLQQAGEGLLAWSDILKQYSLNQ